MNYFLKSTIVLIWLLSYHLSFGDPDIEVSNESEANSDIEEFGGWLEEGEVSKDFNNWLKEFSRVDLVVYNNRVAWEDPLVKNNKIHPGVVKDLSVKLTEEEVAMVKRFTTGVHKPYKKHFCYEPHHGFIFYDKKGKIVGHLEICLLCSRHESFPKKGLSEFWDLVKIKKLITDKNLPNFATFEEWSSYFEGLK